ncbi:adenosine receptor A1-like [Ambystoma mexicanum]|uniref:adenosine receptor A1-like n=1 Tax=Ambystoma mexicanum TaxID=8296 RepID=UPI0037E911B7
MKKRRMTLAVIFCWLLSCLIGFSPMMGWNRFQQYVDKNRTTSAAMYNPSERSIIGHDLPYGGFLSKVYFSNRRAFNYSEVHGPHLGSCSFAAVFSPEYQVYFVFFACTLVPLGIMLGLYADIFRVIHGHFMSQSMRAAKRGEAHMAYTLFMLMGIFCACWIPLNVVNSVRLLCHSCAIPEDLTRLAVLLSHMNSLANPLVYAMRKKNFGRALQSVFLRYVLWWPKLKTCCAKAKVYPQM